MKRISQWARKELKKPLGKLVRDASLLKEHIGNSRIVTVGDICTLAVLDLGIIPHLAVFDYRYRRKDLEKEDIDRLKKVFPSPRRFPNPPGTISDELIQQAGKILHEGGAVLIDGEDDLAALAFINAANEDYLILYGQPEEGIVIVRADMATKDKVKEILES